MRARRASGYSLQPTAYSLAAAVALASASASAANWEIAPRVEGGYHYNDNYYLEQPGGETEVSGAAVDASVAFRTVDPRTTIEIKPSIWATYYPDEKEADTADYYLDARVHDETPRRRMGVEARYAHEDVVRSELPLPDDDGGLGEPVEADSGRILESNTRDLIRLAPYLSYDVTQRARFDMQARFTDASYERNVQGGQQDFTESGLSIGGGFRTSPRSVLLLHALASRYETTIDADAYGADLEWTTEYSPTSRFYVRIGAQQTEADGRDAQTSVIGGIGGMWESQRNRLFLDLTRTVGATSSGTIMERHQLRFRLNHDISERVSTLLGARLSRDEAIEELSVYPTREYASAEAGFEWRFTRSWALTATYSYRWQEYEDEASDASANGFLLGLVYEPKRAQ